jgi:pimeloyl-ACP methyl ester carboxylesterase
VRRLGLALLALALAVAAFAPAAVAASSDLPLKRRLRRLVRDRRRALDAPGVLRAGLADRGARLGTAQRRRDLEPARTRNAARADRLPGVAKFTRVCAYDRPGTINSFEPLEFSRSSPVAMPRTTAGAVSDLHRLLDAAKVPGPYVFVNHSTGGLIDRLYASEHPREVAGMVLVDALAEYLQNGFDRPQMSAYEALNNGPVEGLDYPQIESFDFRRSFAQLRAADRRQPFPGVPLSVLSHGKPFALPESLPGGLSSAVIEKAWSDAQDKLAKLAPGAVHVVAKGSSHYIMLSQPKLVIDQVSRVVRAAR